MRSSEERRPRAPRHTGCRDPCSKSSRTEPVRGCLRASRLDEPYDAATSAGRVADKAPQLHARQILTPRQWPARGSCARWRRHIVMSAGIYSSHSRGALAECMGRFTRPNTQRDHPNPALPRVPLLRGVERARNQPLRERVLRNTVSSPARLNSRRRSSLGRCCEKVGIVVGNKD